MQTDETEINQYENIYPGPSSQTTSVEIENLATNDSFNLGSSDATTPVIHARASSSWEDAAREVLQEYADLWKELSRL